MLRQQFGRLGNTTYTLANVEADIQGGPMAALSVLGKLRHELIARLDAAFSQPAARHIAQVSVLPELRANTFRECSANVAPQLLVLCRTETQLAAALRSACAGVIADFPQIEGQESAIDAARRRQRPIYLATPRIQKPGETSYFARLVECRADGVLARNLAAIAWFAAQKTPVVADASLNAVNDLAVDWLLCRGASRVTIANDLGREGVARLLETTAPTGLEAIVHQHIPLMHSEHCLFCAGIARASNRGDCGQPCQKHTVRLRDRLDVEHLAVAEAFCRNTLYSGVAQTAVEQMPALLQRGVRYFRVELAPDDLHGKPDEIVRIYTNVLSGKITGLTGRKELLAACGGKLARSPLAN